MAISLDSIFKPFNEFFLNKFSGDGSPLKFRFARQPHAFSDSDFVLPDHAGDPPSGALAHELLSLLADRIIKFDDDGQTVWQGPSRASDLYVDEILGLSAVWYPSDLTDADARMQRFDAYNHLWALAKSDTNNKAASITEGPGVPIYPAIADPEGWWNPAADVWTHQPPMLIKGAATSPSSPGPSNAPLLRARLDPAALQAVLDANAVAPPPASDAPPLQPRFRIAPQILSQLAEVRATEVSPVAEVARFPVMRAEVAGPALGMARRVRFGGPAVEAELPIRRGPITAFGDRPFALHDVVKTLPFRNRLDLELLVAEQKPTEAVTVSDVTIEFDYCAATLSRPWLNRAFLESSFWAIPGTAAGAMSANDGRGLPGLPAGFVAIKNLKITAPWTAEDISNLGNSVQFGPFNFDSTIVDGAIGHPGIQIIGWMIEDTPALPPNSSP